MIFDATLDFHGMGKITSEQISLTLELFLSSAHQEGHQHLLIITGKGINSTGLVRETVNRDLGRNKLISKFRIASAEEGGTGAFEVWLDG